MLLNPFMTSWVGGVDKYTYHLKKKLCGISIKNAVDSKATKCDKQLFHEHKTLIITTV